MKAGVKYERKSSFAEVLVSILIFIAVLYIIGSIGNKKESDTASYSHSRYSSSYSTKSTTGSGSSYNSSTKKIQPEQAVQIKIQPEQATQRKIIPEQAVQRKTIHAIHTMMVMMIYTWMTIMIMTGIIKTAIMLTA